LDGRFAVLVRCVLLQQVVGKGKPPELQAYFLKSSKQEPPDDFLDSRAVIYLCIYLD